MTGAARPECGRPTKSGKPCTLPPLAWRSMRGAAPRSCWVHLTDQERDVYDAAKRERDARWAAEWEHALSQDPACWSWPDPDPDAWMKIRDEYSEGVQALLTQEHWQMAAMRARRGPSLSRSTSGRTTR